MLSRQSLPPYPLPVRSRRSPHRQSEAPAVKRLMWSELVADAFCKLPKDQVLLLLTPVVPPFDAGLAQTTIDRTQQLSTRLARQSSLPFMKGPYGRNSGLISPPRMSKDALAGRTLDLAADPFESLGRTLSKSTRRVVHLPFVPALGLSEIHMMKIREASAIIIVNCEPVGTVGEVLQSSLHDQRMAALHAAKVFSSLKQHALDILPCAVIHCGSKSSFVADYHDLVLQCADYSPESLVAAANHLLES